MDKKIKKGKTEWTVTIPGNPYFEIPIEADSDGIRIAGEVIHWNELEVAKLRIRGVNFQNEADGH